MPKEKELSYTSISAQVKFLQGKILTIVDASYSNERQLKAVKDLVNKMFSEQLTWIGQLCYPSATMMSREQVNETIGDVEKIEAEAVNFTKGLVRSGNGKGLARAEEL
jgi:hypothetical protein